MKKSMYGWEFRRGIEDATHKVCTTLGLRRVWIRWSNSIDTASIDRKGNVTLCDIADDVVVSKQLFMKYMGFVIHELLHCKYTEFDLEYSNHFVRMLTNGLEDARIENAAVASGLVGNIGEVLAVLANGMVDEALDAVSNWDNPAQFPFVIAMFCRNHVEDRLPIHPKVLPIFETARLRLNDCRGTPAVRDLAQWVFDQLNALAEPEEKPTPADGDPSDKPKDNPSEGNPADGNGSDGDASDKPTKSADGDSKDGKPSKGESSVQKPQPHDAVCPEPDLKKDKVNGGGISWSPDQKIIKPQSHAEPLSEDAIWKVSPVGGAKLRYEVRRLFEMSGIDEFQLNRRHGQLDAGNLHTIAAGNDRVFKRHYEEGGIDSAVVFIMDCSGSMFGYDSYMSVAAPVMATMMDTLDRAGVATSIVTFGTHVSLLKPWEMTAKKAMPYIARLRSGSDNSDSQALRYAHSLLHTRPEKRKVVFILADGGVDGNDEKRCRRQALSGERLGITTIGVGIQADLSRMYPNNITINDVKELATTSFKQIKLVA